jgi:hypothetical protein
MIHFATPDFGAGGAVMLAELVGWVIVFCLVLIGCILGSRSIRSSAPGFKNYGILLLLASGVLPLSCCLGPSIYVRLAYGSFPLRHYDDEKMKEGMSMKEVEEILGPPHCRDNSRKTGEYWTYWTSGIDGYVRVYFGPDERVTLITLN